MSPWPPLPPPWSTVSLSSWRRVGDVAPHFGDGRRGENPRCADGPTGSDVRIPSSAMGAERSSEFRGDERAGGGGILHGARERGIGASVRGILGKK